MQYFQGLKLQSHPMQTISLILIKINVKIITSFLITYKSLTGTCNFHYKKFWSVCICGIRRRSIAFTQLHEIGPTDLSQSSLTCYWLAVSKWGSRRAAIMSEHWPIWSISDICSKHHDGQEGPKCTQAPLVCLLHIYG